MRLSDAGMRQRRALSLRNPPDLSKSERRMNGPSADIEVILTAIQLAARDINLFTFERSGGGILPTGQPGSHISLRLPTGLVRDYSLVDPSDDPRSYTVGIKRDPNSRGGSQWIHNHLRVGQTLIVGPPRNNFPLNEDAAHSVFIAGGIGITPIYSMIRRLARLGCPYKLFYSCRSRSEAAFLSELSETDNVHLHFDDEHSAALLPVADIVARAPAAAHLYCCGPEPMIVAFKAACGASGRSDDEVHVEHFTATVEAAAGGFEIVLARSKAKLQVCEGQTILQAVIDAGVDASYSCEQGICGSCETRVIEGIPDHRDAILTASERATNKTMMICCSGSKTARLVLAL
jgi:ferredoxin-NADP reductase